jgi:hypothetical protein
MVLLLRLDFSSFSFYNTISLFCLQIMWGIIMLLLKLSMRDLVDLRLASMYCNGS